MKKLISIIVLCVVLLMTNLVTNAQTTEGTSTTEPDISSNSSKLLNGFAFSFGGGYNPTVTQGNYASYITLEYPIVKLGTDVIVLQLSRIDANNAREGDFGPNYNGLQGAPNTANHKSFFDNNLQMLNLGYHKKLGNRMSIGLNGGIGRNSSRETFTITIPYTQGTGLETNVNFIAKRKHNFLGYTIGTDFRYALDRLVALQAQIMVVKNATDLSVQIPVMVGFSFQFK